MEKTDKKNPMVHVIDAGLIGIHDTNDTLSRIWRILLYNTGIKAYQWHSLLSKWLFKLKANISEKESTSMKGNITRMLSKPKLSWNGLLTGFAILGYEKLDIKITLWKRGKAVEVTLTVNDLSKETEESENVK